MKFIKTADNQFIRVNFITTFGVKRDDDNYSVVANFATGDQFTLATFYPNHDAEHPNNPQLEAYDYQQSIVNQINSAD